MTRVLSISTYELGAQPLGLATVAARLRAAGHEVHGRDLSVDELTEDDLLTAEAVCVSVPMHTALRLAAPVIERVRRSAPGVPVALHGLYAPVGEAAGLLEPGDIALAGETGEALLEWLSTPRNSGPPAVRIVLGRPRPDELVPDRAGLPELDGYAHFTGGPAGAGERLVGAVEATRGCSHRCRHCPVPVVYDGRTRAVALESLLADIDHLVARGAEHIHFADPDFLNRPGHARAVVAAMHDRHPALSYDATVKVSHVLAHRGLWPELAAAGCAFVVSAVESVSPLVLERLDKGHRAEEADEAVAVLRAAGIEPRPSLLPFTPWSTLDDLIALLDFAARNDLVWNIDPVQWGIRLLLPPGSLLLREPDAVLVEAIARARRAADRSGASGASGAGAGTLAEALGVAWLHADPTLDELATAVAELAERSVASGDTLPQSYAAIRRLVFDAAGRPDPGTPEPLSASGWRGPERPRLTEAWFCCAEPTAAQLAGATVSRSCAFPTTPGSG